MNAKRREISHSLKPGPTYSNTELGDFGTDLRVISSSTYMINAQATRF